MELDRAYDLSEVKIVACNIKSLTVEACAEDQASSFSKVAEADFGESNGQLADRGIKASFQARHVKFIIKEGWSDFCAVFKVGLLGGGSGY